MGIFHQSGLSMTDKKTIVEERWREFFADPSQWWDHRSEKVIRLPKPESAKDFNGSLLALSIELFLVASISGSLLLNRVLEMWG